MRVFDRNKHKLKLLFKTKKVYEKSCQMSTNLSFPLQDFEFDKLVDVPAPPITRSQLIEEEETTRSLSTSTEISESEARQALLKYISRRCCYGKGVAKDMSIIKIEHMCAFHYSLETFSEKRQMCWSFEPYLGGAIESNSNSFDTKNIWEISAQPTALFQNQVSQMEVPNTATLRMCHICGGVGRKRCLSCNGNGWESCFSCHGDGHKPSFSNGERERCWKCMGSGRLRCWKCNGDGRTQCQTCTGTGQLKCFVRLVITWSNHCDDYIVDKASTAVPDNQIRSVTGEVVFEEEHPRLWPINHFPDNTINQASAQLVKTHEESYLANEKLLMQRQRVRLIPIATIHYLWKGKAAKQYSVFGFERKVYAPDYPQTCCCGCVIQ